MLNLRVVIEHRGTCNRTHHKIALTSVGKLSEFACPDRAGCVDGNHDVAEFFGVQTRQIESLPQETDDWADSKNSRCELMLKQRLAALHANRQADVESPRLSAVNPKASRHDSEQFAPLAPQRRAIPQPPIRKAKGRQDWAP